MTDSLTVRDFRPEDREDIRRICRETCSDPFLLKNEDVLFGKYADYYMNEEPELICILADQNGRAQGYILCSADPDLYISRWRESYLPAIRGHGPVNMLLQVHTMWEVRHMAKKGYSAHLHIDISPAYQHAGGGTLLTDALRKKLRSRGISGLYLGCAEANAAGMRFYRHYGFSVHHRYPGGTVFTIKTERM